MTSIESFIQSPAKLKQLYKRVLFVVSLSQIFGGAGLAAGVTVGALLAQEMLGTDAYAGIPSALITLGSAGAAFAVGRLSQRYGRRIGLSVGFAVGGLGAIGVIIAALTNHVMLLFIALFIYGAGTATNLQARYAGTDLASKKQRATAISTTMVMTTFGAVLGPNLVEKMGEVAVAIGVPALTGPFILSAVAFITAGLTLFLLLRPDPLEIAKKIATYAQETQSNNTEQPTHNHRGLIVGATVMVLTQIVMVAIMTMTPIHMKHHGHSLADVGLVIGFHVGFMYLPSLITGILVDKIGRTAMSIAAGIILLCAGLVASFASGDSMLVFIIALSLLGLGWNFGLISGTAQVVDATEPATRAKTQGKLDVLVALAGASGGALSGLVVANASFAILSLTGGLLSLALIPVVIWAKKG
ncbi:MFS transporter [Lysinibacillus piscis]|uniref:Tetracycline resistance protein n=1 Tax=Lysinibacillus piscis TaxID=2518931 RepID=A0ABQ5NJ91_9BACI|nr:MFS transporter [Lysinibacillus sp. KH24]GLC88423.1 tetracycline resistance protein [Lysinibacillus sp. KH24]